MSYLGVSDDSSVICCPTPLSRQHPGCWLHPEICSPAAGAAQAGFCSSRDFPPDCRLLRELCWEASRFSPRFSFSQTCNAFGYCFGFGSVLPTFCPPAICAFGCPLTPGAGVGVHGGHMQGCTAPEPCGPGRPSAGCQPAGIGLHPAPQNRQQSLQPGTARAGCPPPRLSPSASSGAWHGGCVPVPRREFVGSAGWAGFEGTGVKKGLGGRGRRDCHSIVWVGKAL